MIFVTVRDKKETEEDKCEIVCQVGGGRVVPGLEEGVQGMCRGETR